MSAHEPEPPSPLPRRGERPAAGDLLGESPLPDRATTAALVRARETCEPFERAVHADVAGELSGRELDELRAHLAECEHCREVRRSSVETLARLGRRLRANRAASTAPPRTPRRSRSVVIFVAAAAAFFAAARSGVFDRVDPRLFLDEVQGDVRAGGESVAAGERRLLTRGDVVEGGADAAAVLVSGRIDVRFEGELRLLVESAFAPRLRLVAGELAASGRGRLVTDAGVFDLEEGTAALVVDGDGVSALLVRGTATWTDADGTLRLTPGRRLDVPTRRRRRAPPRSSPARPIPPRRGRSTGTDSFQAREEPGG